MENKISKLYIADVKLNEKDKVYNPALIVENRHGVLIVFENLFVTSYFPDEPVTAIIKNKIYIKDVSL